MLRTVIVIAVLLACILIASTSVQARNGATAPLFSQMLTPNLFTFSLTTPNASSATDLAINGPMQFNPIVYTGIALPESSRPDYTVDMPVMLGNINDDMTGCSGDPWRPYNEYGQSFADAWVLMKASVCVETRYSRVAGSNARGIIVMGCDPAGAGCDPALQMPLAVVNLTQFQVTLITVTYNDGLKIQNYLRTRYAAANATASVPAKETLVMTIKSSAPLVSSERAALATITSSTTMGYFAGVRSYDTLQLWDSNKFLDFDGGYDPCRNRTAMIWCEGPHVVMIQGLYRNWTTPLGIPAAFGKLTELRFLSMLTNSWTGSIPDDWCALTKLRVLWLAQQTLAPYITSMPDCDWTEMQDLWVTGNSLTQLPTKLANWTKLRSLTATSNQLTSIPSLAALTKMVYIDLSSNKINQTFPLFPKVTALNQYPLSVLSLGNNKFYGLLQATQFDGWNSLTVLDLNTNSLVGVLPNLNYCTRLTYIDLSSQRNMTTGVGGLSGMAVPIVWAPLTSVVTLLLQENALVSGTTSKQFMFTAYLTALQTLDVSYNFLTGPMIPTDTNKTVGMGLILRAAVGPALTVLRLNNNNYTGPWLAFDVSYFQTLKKLYLQNNFITEVPPDLFLTRITTFDLSNNNVTTPADGSFIRNSVPTDFQYLNLQGNPGLVYPALPSWAATTASKVQQPGQAFLCSQLQVTTALEMTFLIDASFTSFKSCQCASGTFGKPPLCAPVPTVASLNPYQVISASDIGSSFSSLIQQTGGVGSQLSNNNTNNANVGTQVQAFSDSMYGENRLTQGLSTTFVIDLTDLYAADPEAYAAADQTVPAYQVYRTSDPTAVNSMWTPVRQLTVRLHISGTEFHSFEDLINLYEGGSDLKGTRVFTIRGTDDLTHLTESPYTVTSDYRNSYDAEIKKISDPRLIEIPVYTNKVSLQFTSRSTSGLHFYATYSYDFTCPAGMFFDRISNPADQRCRLNYALYNVDSGIRTAVFVVAAIALAFITFTIIVLLARWNEGVFKAGSRIFLLLILVLMEMMALGALLYAAIPDMNSSSGKAVCIGRAWLTALPLSGILAVLLAKNRRLYIIFSTTKLQIKVQSDWDIFVSVCIVCSVQIALLIIFTALPLSEPLLELGKGSISDKLVTSCSQESGFMSWIGAEIAFIGTMMLAAAYLGFKTRDLPTQYNESMHLQNALVLLMFFVVIIIPLDVFIQDSPEASVLIQGLGQSFLAIVFTAILFLPKLYYVLSPPKGGNSSIQVHHSNSSPTASSDGRGNSAPKFKNGSTQNLGNNNSNTAGTQQPGASMTSGNSSTGRRPIPQAARPSVGAVQGSPRASALNSLGENSRRNTYAANPQASNSVLVTIDADAPHLSRAPSNDVAVPSPSAGAMNELRPLNTNASSASPSSSPHDSPVESPVAAQRKLNFHAQKPSIVPEVQGEVEIELHSMNSGENREHGEGLGEQQQVQQQQEEVQQQQQQQQEDV